MNRSEFDKLFHRPTAEYRGMPFWAWNGKLEPEELSWQIEQLKVMGFGGFFMHPRAGLDTAYLSDEFMDCVKVSVEKAKAEGLLAGLYDEDRFPSGAAGGLVTVDPQYRARRIRFTPVGADGITVFSCDIPVDGGAVQPPSQWEVLAYYDIQLDAEGYLKSCSTLSAEESPLGEKWAVVLEECDTCGRHNGYPYADLLNPAATERFLQVTHERYKAAVGTDFGGVIPSIFTDEPQMQKKGFHAYPTDGKDLRFPWTEDFAATYRRRYGAEVLDTLPELVWETRTVSVARYRYHEHICERFRSGFTAVVSRWCRENGIAFTGHHMAEGSLSAQCNYGGDVMASYGDFDIPGVDMLCDAREYNTLKQCQSAAHQYGRTAMLSELYGVTDWDYDFRGHLTQGNWQAALGVTLRVPHLSWYTMTGRGKRDYPASIHYQSPWYTEYALVEDHFARLNTALTRGKPVVRIAVVHPIRSFWQCYGVRSQVEARWRENMDRCKALTEWLLFSQLDFDFLCEATLPDLCPKASAPLRVGEMAYDAVIVPDLQTICRTTLERLLAFRDAGGTLLVMGSLPTCVDGIPCEDAKALAAQPMDFSRRALLEALEPLREVSLHTANGTVPNYLHQLRRDGEDRWLFLCRGDKAVQYDTDPADRLFLRLRGSWQPTRYDTMTGETTPLSAAAVGGWTELRLSLHTCDSVLLHLTPGTPVSLPAQPSLPMGTKRVSGPVAVTLTEPNALVLDLAEYRLDDAADWKSPAEVLTIDETLRSKLGWRLRNNGDVQPWTLSDDGTRHTVHLRYRFRSALSVEGASLALEEAAATTVTLNGVAADPAVTGWYADHGIQTIALPPIQAGENILCLDIDYGEKTNLENAVLLGDFGVRLAGACRELTEPVRFLHFGDITAQGLPHYGGNVIYHIPAEDAHGITVSHYRGVHVTVDAAGKRLGTTTFPPYSLAFTLPAGCQTLDVTLYGHRGNTFGALHNWDPTVRYKGPNLWHCTGTAWAPEYRVKPLGILTAPVLW